MHGIIFEELKGFVTKSLGEEGWPTLLEAAGMQGRVFDQLQAYDDGDILNLVSTASDITGKSVPELLQAFGEFIVPDLLAMSEPLRDPSWKTLDILENTETVIHSVVRLDNPGASPPELKVRRTGDNQVTVEYSSSRKMCSLAKGICLGIAKNLNEEVRIDEPLCMLKHDDHCSIVVSLI